MRIDHLAFRVHDRQKTVNFLCDALGYKVQQEFPIYFNEEQTEMAMCTALEPPEKLDAAGAVDDGPAGPRPAGVPHPAGDLRSARGRPAASSTTGSRHDPGIHHIAIQVDSVEKTMGEWQRKGWAEFTSDAPMKCEGLTQVFTKPSELTGVIFEFIERGAFGFCKENVKALMESTKDINAGHAVKA